MSGALRLSSFPQRAGKMLPERAPFVPCPFAPCPFAPWLAEMPTRDLLLGFLPALLFGAVSVFVVRTVLGSEALATEPVFATLVLLAGGLGLFGALSLMGAVLQQGSVSPALAAVYAVGLRCGVGMVVPWTLLMGFLLISTAPHEDERAFGGLFAAALLLGGATARVAVRYIRVLDARRRTS